MDVLSFAQKTFAKSWMLGKPYLEQRGINAQSVKRFGLGYATPFFARVARGAGFAEADLLSVGLARMVDRKLVDCFYHRLMFPILGADGTVHGFAGRSIGESQTRYINSRESAQFKKGELLFGLHQARAAIAESGEVIVCEGYIDVVLMQQHGYLNTVGLMGNGFTAHQRCLLEQVGAKKVILFLDNDEAGKRATLQSLGECHTTHVAMLSSSKDPAQAFCQGVDEVQMALKECLSGRAFIERFGCEQDRFGMMLNDLLANELGLAEVFEN